jgi:nucleotide-binding universal stress UspA family protein
MNTIIVPLDGSPLANQIVPYVRTLAHHYEATIYLLFAVSESQRRQFFAQHPDIIWNTDEAPLEGQEDEPDERMFDLLRDYATEHLDPVADALRAAGLTVETEVVFGWPASCIVEFASSHDASLIAMVTHGYSGLRRWALGSVTDKVVHMARVPVFVVRGSEHPVSDAPLTLRRILVPLDGSDFARQALPVATDLATRSGAALHLVQAAAPGHEYPPIVRSIVPGNKSEQPSQEAIEWAEQHITAAADELRQAGYMVSSHATGGYPAEVIIEEARAQQSDLIVMATHGYSGIQRWSLGSVADKVLHATTTPLLLVHVTDKPAPESSA